MRTFRSLGDLPMRLGMTLESGQTVTELPYAEGVTLTTIVDDFTRIRIEPQILTFAARAFAAATPALNNIITLQARRMPLRLIYIDATGSTGLLNVARAENIALPAVVADLVPVMLEGPSSLLPGFVVPPAAGAVTTYAPAAAILSTIGFNIPSAPTTAFLPLILLPGEQLIFQNSQVNTQLICQLVWQQLPNITDVVTSQAPILLP